MAAEDFFNRWAKRNAEAAAARSGNAEIAAPSPATPSKTDAQPKPLPTMDDVAALTHESDFSPYVTQGVDETVQRSAMKKLFSDPHFNVMDGLDIYVGDYSQPDPMPPEMLASLLHAKALLDPLAQFEKPLMALIDTPIETEAVASDGPLIAASDHAEQTPVEAPDTESIPQQNVETPATAANETSPAPSSPDTGPKPKDPA